LLLWQLELVLANNTKAPHPSDLLIRTPCEMQRIYLVVNSALPILNWASPSSLSVTVISQPWAVTISWTIA